MTSEANFEVIKQRSKLLKQPAAAFGVIFITLLAAAGCSDFKKPEIQVLYGSTMGTSYSVRVLATQSEAQSLKSGIDYVLEDINQSMSTYIEDSELNKLNNSFSTDWYEVTDGLFNVLELAQQVSEQTNGAFDITVAPLVDIWGFGPQARREQIPHPIELSSILSGTGFEAIELDSNKSSVRKTEPRRLDLSAIAKGYGVDLIADYLDAQSVQSYLIEVGGEMRLKGLKPGDQSWRIAVETPDSGAREVYKIIELTDAALATSGDYRNYFEVDGVRYSHTIDPATGYPISHNLVSVTVITEQCAMADAYATGMMVMGVEKSLTLAEQQGLAVFLIEKHNGEFVEHSSSAFKELIGEI